LALQIDCHKVSQPACHKKEWAIENDNSKYLFPAQVKVSSDLFKYAAQTKIIILTFSIYEHAIPIMNRVQLSLPFLDILTTLLGIK